MSDSVGEAVTGAVGDAVGDAVGGAVGDATELFTTLGRDTVKAAMAAKLLSALILALISLIIIKIITRILYNIFEKTHFERGMKDFLLSASKVCLWFIAATMVATTLGVDAASLVAVLSVAGLALSLSIQGIMTNLFSGITLLATRPFLSGDYVEINSVSGTVCTIGLFYTTVITVDNKSISIPNNEITSSKVINYTHEPMRRVELCFSASYDNSTQQVKDALMEAINADSRILTEPVPFVGLSTFKDSCIEYIIRVWCKGDDYWPVYYALNESVRESFKRNGVEMSYNHLNVHMVKD